MQSYEGSPKKDDSEAKQPTYLLSSALTSSSSAWGLPTFFFTLFTFFFVFDFKVASTLGLMERESIAQVYLASDKR